MHRIDWIFVFLRQIWQHCDCVGVKETNDSYYCEQCHPRPYPKVVQKRCFFAVMLMSWTPLKEIPHPSPPSGEDNSRFFLTLCHNDLRVKVGDCVYLCPPKDDKKSPRKLSVKEKGREESGEGECNSNYIILRVSSLVVDPSGRKWVLGSHFLRPSETYHEPSRKFYQKEVLRSPIMDRVPIEDVKGLCCVLDPSTYCKGRPKGFKEEDVFICEMRTDRHAKSFNKIPKNNHFFVNTQSYAFDRFAQKLTIKRDYTVCRDSSDTLVVSCVVLLVSYSLTLCPTPTSRANPNPTLRQILTLNALLQKRNAY